MESDAQYLLWLFENVDWFDLHWHIHAELMMDQEEFDYWNRFSE